MTDANETIQEVAKITFEQATEVTQDPWFFVPIIILFAIFLIILVLWASIAKARTSDGRKVEGTNVIQTANFLIAFFIYFFSIGIILMLIIFPVWLQFIN